MGIRCVGVHPFRNEDFQGKKSRMMTHWSTTTYEGLTVAIRGLPVDYRTYIAENRVSQYRNAKRVGRQEIAVHSA